jgi:hypothetical protein
MLHACGLERQALGCAYGNETRRVLEQTRLWNGQHWQSTDEVPGETKTFKQAVHTQVETKKSMQKESLLT